MKKLKFLIFIFLFVSCDDNIEPDQETVEPIYSCNLKYNENCELISDNTESFNWDSTAYFNVYINCDTTSSISEKFYKIEAFSYFGVKWRRLLEIHFPETEFIINKEIKVGKGWCDTYVHYSVMFERPNGWSGGDSYTHYIESDSSNQIYDSGSIFITEFSEDSLEVLIDSVNVYLLNYDPLSYSTSCRLLINSKFRIKKIQ
ncbi:hypothetical protein ACFLSE_09100 [Bacteroidota bacterium]